MHRQPPLPELLVFLTLRLVDPSTAATYRWSASSVDPADLPAFFRDYLGDRLPAWAASLSQSTHGEYDDPRRVALAAHTDGVREAVDSHQLIIANHALLLAHWPDLAPHADQTLSIVDEAHALRAQPPTRSPPSCPPRRPTTPLPASRRSCRT